MKLETILNAYGIARAKHAQATGIELLVAWKYYRQAEAFKERLLAVLRNIDEKNEQIYSYDIYEFPSRCGVCGKQLQLVRPGKWQCPRCG